MIYTTLNIENMQIYKEKFPILACGLREIRIFK